MRIILYEDYKYKLGFEGNEKVYVSDKLVYLVMCCGIFVLMVVVVGIDFFVLFDNGCWLEVEVNCDGSCGDGWGWNVLIWVVYYLRVCEGIKKFI